MITINKLEVPKIVYVDMDNTINYYIRHMLSELRKDSTIKYPQSKKGFYLGIPPMEDGINALKTLHDANYDVCLATRPSYPNLHCYSEKAEWVEKHLGTEWVPKLYLVPDKARLIGDFLVDDYIWSNFTGKFILFERNWPEVLEIITKDENPG